MVGVPASYGKNGFNKKFLPALPNYKQAHTDARSARTSPRLISPFDYHAI